nr:MAG TPA_asm: hypothetical protein [Caudoviricetes sp.]DAR00303.1 MAG TPA: hypothetical protein [Caudoviricetes sp.]
MPLNAPDMKLVFGLVASPHRHTSQKPTEPCDGS